METIQQLLKNRAIELVPTSGQGLYSLLFTVPKKNGTWQAVLDLKFLNKFVAQKRFRMETLRSKAEALQHGDFLTSIDLTDAYLRVPIFPLYRRFLCFCIGGAHYQFTALPFGLLSTPRVFTKLLIIPITYMREQGIHIHPYLDDLMIQAPTRERSERDTKKVQKLLQDFGFLVNREKSSLKPTQRLEHLGVEIDTNQCKLIFPRNKANTITSLAMQVIRSSSTPLMTLAKPLGLMISTLDSIQWARLHARALQHFLAPFQLKIIQKEEINVLLSLQVKESLSWWTCLSNLTKGRHFWTPERTQVFIDASPNGLGGHLSGLNYSGDLVARGKEVT